MNGKKLKLGLRYADEVVIYPTDDEDKSLTISVGQVMPNGQVMLEFDGDAYSVWRSTIYRKGQMKKDRQR